jgi:uncharacterized protein YecT (DUF1311 family)
MKRLFALALLLPLPCLANVDCATAMADPDINECAARDLAQADATLNRVYRETLASLAELAAGNPDAKDARKQLVEAQRLWVKFRESDCDAVFTLNQGGTIRTAMYYGCMTQHAELRTKQLREFVQ